MYHSAKFLFLGGDYIASLTVLVRSVTSSGYKGYKKSYKFGGGDGCPEIVRSYYFNNNRSERKE
jgi:hypothetical protein